MLRSSLADRYGLPALGNDAGKTRHAESVEHVADFRHLLAGDSGHILTRSGVISSVHAFAQSANRQTWFKWFLALSFAVFAGFFL